MIKHNIEDKRRLCDMEENVNKNIEEIKPYLENSIVNLKLGVDNLNFLKIVTAINKEIYEDYLENRADDAYFKTNFLFYLQNLVYYKKEDIEDFNVISTIDKLKQEYENLIYYQDSFILNKCCENARNMSLVQNHIEDAYLALAYEKSVSVFTKDVTFDMLEKALSCQQNIINQIYDVDILNLLVGFYSLVLKHKEAINIYNKDQEDQDFLSTFEVITDKLPSALIEDLTLDINSVKNPKDYAMPYQQMLINKKPFIRIDNVIYCLNSIALANMLYPAIRNIVKEYDENLFEAFLANESQALVNNPNLMHLLGPVNELNVIDDSEFYIPFVEDLLEVKPKLRTDLDKVRSEKINDYDYNNEISFEINEMYKVQLDLNVEEEENTNIEETCSNQMWAQSLLDGIKIEEDSDNITSNDEEEFKEELNKELEEELEEAEEQLEEEVQKEEFKEELNKELEQTKEDLQEETEQEIKEEPFRYFPMEKEELRLRKDQDFDMFACVEVEDLLEITFPPYIQKLLDVAQMVNCDDVYNWVTLFNASSSNSFNTLLENMSNKMKVEKETKIVNLNEQCKTLLFYNEKSDIEMDQQRIKNVAANMKLNNKDKWDSYHFIYNSDGEIVNVKTIEIDKNIFTDKEWGIIDNMVLALKRRKR